MTIRIAINGFGRIGRLVLRAIVESEDKGIEVVAINDLGSIEANAHLLKYDSVHGRFDQDVKVTNSGMIIEGKEIKVIYTISLESWLIYNYFDNSCFQEKKKT